MTLPNQPDWNGWGTGFIDPRCHVITVGPFGGQAQVLEYSAKGEFLSQYETHNYIPHEATATVSGDRVPLPGEQRSHRRADRGCEDERSHRHLAEEPGNTQWHWVGATDDGSIMATSRTSSANNDEVFYWGNDGQELASFTLPPNTRAADISKNGSYLLVISDAQHNVRAASTAGDVAAR